MPSDTSSENPTGALSGDAEVQANQNAAAALGVRIPGVGGSYPGTTTPVISASGLSSDASPAGITAPSIATGSAGLQGWLDTYFGSLQGNANTAGTNMQNSLDALLSAIGGESSANELEDQADEKYGVNTAQNAVNDINTQIAADKNSTAQQIAKLQTANPTGTLAEGGNIEIQRLQDASTARQANLAVINLANNNQLAAATQLAKTAADAQFEQQQNTINALQTTYTDNKDLFSTAEQEQFEAAQAERQNQLDTQKQETLDNYEEQIKLNDPLYQAQTAEANASAAKDYADLNGGVDASDLTTIETPSGGSVQVPASLAPYYNQSQSGTGYIDASTLQGTADEKDALINEATSAGLKVITNKDTALDLTNIEDAYAKLSTVSSTLQGIDQPGWIQRSLYGLGATGAASALQSDPQQAAAGVINDVGTDILKAMQGVQGSRMSQAAVAQVTKNLPSIYDTQAVVDQKLATLRSLLADRQNAILGQPETPTAGDQGNSATTVLTGPDGQQYNVPNAQVNAFIAAGGHY